jgi:hypothetical protein
MIVEKRQVRGLLRPWPLQTSVRRATRLSGRLARGDSDIRGKSFSQFAICVDQVRSDHKPSLRVDIPDAPRHNRIAAEKRKSLCRGFEHVEIAHLPVLETNCAPTILRT